MRIFGKKESIYDEMIIDVLNTMRRLTPDADEYPALVDHLDKLSKMKAEERRRPVSWDTVAIVAGNLLGIGLIVAYEQKHVMNARGLGFVLKPRPNQP